MCHEWHNKILGKGKSFSMLWLDTRSRNYVAYMPGWCCATNKTGQHLDALQLRDIAHFVAMILVLNPEAFHPEE
jgi:hypothetical protein